MTPEKLSEWKKLAEAATEGPWKYNEHARDDNVFSGNRRIADVYGARIGGTEQNAANATFIAAARTAVPELIAEVERLQRKNEELQGIIDDQKYMQQERFS